MLVQWVDTGASFGVMVIVGIEWGGLISMAGVGVEDTILDGVNGALKWVPATSTMTRSLPLDCIPLTP